MLAKLRYFRSVGPAALGPLKSAVASLPVLEKMGMSTALARRVDAGTLSAAFTVEQAGRRRFFKTHVHDEGRTTVRREHALLQALYPSPLQLELECIQTQEAEHTRLWLVMKALVHLEKPAAGLAVGLAASCAAVLAEQVRLGAVQAPEDSIASLLDEAWLALENLSELGLLSSFMQDQLEWALILIEIQIGWFAPVLCHGDLGPQNIMTDGQQLFLLDWEDAFWGVAGYDHLYWLSFFRHRSTYSRAMWGHTPLGKPLEFAVLLMIVLLKCQLSVLQQSHGENSLDFNQRLQEIVDLAA